VLPSKLSFRSTNPAHFYGWCLSPSLQLPRRPVLDTGLGFPLTSAKISQAPHQVRGDGGFGAWQSTLRAFAPLRESLLRCVGALGFHAKTRREPVCRQVRLSRHAASAGPVAAKVAIAAKRTAFVASCETKSRPSPHRPQAAHRNRPLVHIKASRYPPQHTAKLFGV
jgi:hypothetical protein